MADKFSQTLRIAVLAATFVGLSIAANCGKSGNSDRSISSMTALIPAGWDGTTDWEGSRWAVSDPAESHSAHLTHANKTATPHCTKAPDQNVPYLVRMKSFHSPSLLASETFLRVESISELEALAGKTHGGGQGGCAGIEVISGPGLTTCEIHRAQTTSAAITPPVYDETIKLSAAGGLFSNAAAANITSTMTTLQGLSSRYYSGASGPAASNQVEAIFRGAYAGSSWSSGIISTTQVSHTGIAANQPSVVSGLTGATDDTTIVVIGSHLDSINHSDQSNAPGADDNASGVAILAETMRVLAANNVRFKRRVEWHAYGAEEIGLIGSGQIANSYAADGKKVSAMLQVDMASYAQDGANETIHLFHDDTNAILRRSAKDLLTTYLGGNFSDLGQHVSGTSDHRSWYRAGVPTVFPFENPAAYNMNMHTANDTLANATSPGLAVRVARLILAFLSHHAGIVGSEDDYANKFAATSRDPDIKMAVLDYDQVPAEARPSDLFDGGTVTVFSVPQSMTSLEICGVKASAATACISDRSIGTEIVSDSIPAGRKFFYVVFPAGSHATPERAFGYDQNNSPSHARSVSLLKK
jgi:Zn-dependent M28 family amino/carboxypeptidase